ncbi:hypothetical protein [Methanobacterium subterraneum]|uniref:hypothetical protein n=1 Tax=Methanobacterium subterraneum TaxID=59277 RepID=UPI0012FFE3E2|nr:hypothetical protein [Methanobacterium subterraneum]
MLIGLEHLCGGCRARAYNYFNDILAPDHGCINNQKNGTNSKFPGKLPENLT